MISKTTPQAMSKLSSGYKVLIILFCSALSIPFLFVAYIFIGSEYEEYFNYGLITNAAIIDSYARNGSASAGDFSVDHIYVLGKIGAKTDSFNRIKAKVVLQNSDWDEKRERTFINNVAIGDTLSIKEVGYKMAKILKWKDLELNRSIDYGDKFWLWLLILTLLTIPFFLFRVIYQTIKK